MRKRRYLIGNTVRVMAEFAPRGITVSEPAGIVLQVTSPSGHTTYTFGQDAELRRGTGGGYYCDIPATEIGTWEYTWEATERLLASGRGVFEVVP